MATGLPVQLRLTAPLGSKQTRARFSRSTCAPPRAGVAPDLRPYTVRKGDTLDTIAQKRGLAVKDVVSYNKKITAKSAPALLGDRARHLTSARQAWLSPGRPYCCPRSNFQRCAAGALWRAALALRDSPSAPALAHALTRGSAAA
jgi:hypothetical protein